MPRKSPGRSRQGLGTPARDKGIWDRSPGVIGWADSCKGKMTTDQGSGRKMGSQGSPRLPRPTHLALPSYFHTPPHQRAPTTRAAAASCTELSPLPKTTVDNLLLWEERWCNSPAPLPPGDAGLWRDAMLPPSPQPDSGRNPSGTSSCGTSPGHTRASLLPRPDSLMLMPQAPELQPLLPVTPSVFGRLTSNLCCELSTLICSPDLIPGGQAQSVALSQT